MPPATAQGRHGFHNPGTRAKAQQFPFTSVRFRDAYPPLPCWPSRASMPVAYSLVRIPAQAGLALRPPILVAGVLFHRWSHLARLHLSAPCCHVALSGIRRDIPGSEHTPSPHNRRIYAASPWPQELRGFWPARPARQCLISDSCSSAHGLRSTLPLNSCSPFRSCASLRSLWPAYGRTCTSRSAPLPGAQKKGQSVLPSPLVNHQKTYWTLPRSSSPPLLFASSPSM